MIDKTNLPKGTNEVKDKATTIFELNRDKSLRIIIDITDGEPKAITITNSIIAIMPSQKHFNAKTKIQPLENEPAKEIEDILNTPLKDLLADYTQFFNEV